MQNEQSFVDRTGVYYAVSVSQGNEHDGWEDLMRSWALRGLNAICEAKEIWVEMAIPSCLKAHGTENNNHVL